MERMTELVTALRCARDCYSFPEDTLHVLEQWAAKGDLIGTLLDELPESPHKAFSGIEAAFEACQALDEGYRAAWWNETSSDTWSKPAAYFELLMVAAARWFTRAVELSLRQEAMCTKALNKTVNKLASRLRVYQQAVSCLPVPFHDGYCPMARLGIAQQWADLGEALSSTSPAKGWCSESWSRLVTCVRGALQVMPLPKAEERYSGVQVVVPLLEVAPDGAGAMRHAVVHVLQQSVDAGSDLVLMTQHLDHGGRGLHLDDAMRKSLESAMRAAQTFLNYSRANGWKPVASIAICRPPTPATTPLGGPSMGLPLGLAIVAGIERLGRLQTASRFCAATGELTEDQHIIAVDGYPAKISALVQWSQWAGVRDLEILGPADIPDDTRLTVSRGHWFPDLAERLQDPWERYRAHFPPLSKAPKGHFAVAAADVTAFRLRMDPKKLIVRVDLEDDPLVATDGKLRNVLEWHALVRHRRELGDFLDGRRPLVQGLVRFSAGGGIVVLQCHDGPYIAMAMKDEKAPIHRLHLCAASGLAHSSDEWLSPSSIVARESAEEILIRVGDKWVLPEYKLDELQAASNHLEAVTELAQAEARSQQGLWERKWSCKPMGTVVAAAQLWSLGGRDELSIHWKDKKSEATGLLVLDREYGAVDIMGAVQLTLDCAVSEVTLLDGEAHSANDPPLDRDVFLITPDELAKMFVPGKKARAEAHFKSGDNLGPCLFCPLPKMNPPFFGTAPHLLRRLGLEVEEEHPDISMDKRQDVSVEPCQ